LKKVRFQVAQMYENAGDHAAANGVYRVLADCAVRQSQTLLKDKSYEAALARAQDGEEFSNHLTEGKQESLTGATSSVVSTLTLLHRYPEAEEAQQHLIDFLKTSVDEYDQGVGQGYMLLAGIYSDAQDWHGFEQTLAQFIDWCDRTNAHLAEKQGSVADATLPRNWAQYNLVIAYYQEGDTDTALSKAEDFFTEYSQKPPTNVAYHPGDFAAVALQIAKETKRQDAIDLWQKRTPGGLTIVTLRPVSNH
jgi:tetratricopeptide (TPR) repeat protein